LVRSGPLRVLVAFGFNWVGNKKLKRGLKMTYLILTSDGPSRMVLKRDSEEAAANKAAELRDLGWFRVEVVPQPTTKSA
jgi:hypothetical protein